MMTRKQLVLKLCCAEGKKKQVDVAQMSEIVARLGEITKRDPKGVLYALTDSVSMEAEIFFVAKKRKSRK